MTAEKPFLNPSLTIQDISHDLGIPVRELSVFNQSSSGTAFLRFCQYLDHAMEILKDPQNEDHYSIREI